MRQYEHVRTINLNSNKLRSINEISALPYLLECEAKNNLIKDVEFMDENCNALQYLRVNSLFAVTDFLDPRLDAKSHHPAQEHASATSEQSNLKREPH